MTQSNTYYKFPKALIFLFASYCTFMSRQCPIFLRQESAPKKCCSKKNNHVGPHKNCEVYYGANQCRHKRKGQRPAMFQNKVGKSNAPSTQRGGTEATTTNNKEPY